MSTQLPLSYATTAPRPVNVPWFERTLLELFERFDRKEFLTTFGSQAPPMDVSGDIPWIKLWWDSAAVDLDPAGPYIFKYAGQRGGKSEMITMVITNAEAAMVNMPGSFNYPVYGIRPTQAFIQGPDGNSVGLLPANRLSSMKQAEDLLARMEADVPGFRGKVVEDQLSRFTYVYELADEEFPEFDFTEDRRLYDIKHLDREGAFYNVGYIRGKMYQKGVGAPGTFDTTPEGMMYWTNLSHLEDMTTTLPELPVPCRELAEDEELFRRHPFDPGSVQVTSVVDPNTAGSGGDVAGPLNEILTLLIRIANKFGVQVG